jgi:peptide deformylase
LAAGWGGSDPANDPAFDDIVTVLSILEFPDPRLKTVAQPVRLFDERLRQLVADMAETMYTAPGIGLAATQVDVHQRVIVIDVSENKDRLLVLVNPEIEWKSEETQICEEGCLSVPEIYDEVRRPARVRIKAQNERGENFELDCDEMLAVCVQHEMDHLIGKVFVEYLSLLKQSRIKSKMKKKKARNAT